MHDGHHIKAARFILSNNTHDNDIRQNPTAVHTLAKTIACHQHSNGAFPVFVLRSAPAIGLPTSIAIATVVYAKPIRTPSSLKSLHKIPSNDGINEIYAPVENPRINATMTAPAVVVAPKIANISTAIMKTDGTSMLYTPTLSARKGGSKRQRMLQCRSLCERL